MGNSHVRLRWRSTFIDVGTDTDVAVALDEQLVSHQGDAEQNHPLLNMNAAMLTPSLKKLDIPLLGSASGLIHRGTSRVQQFKHCP